MAHMIDESAGRAACFTAGEPAWHGLGINVANAVTAKEAVISKKPSARPPGT